VVVSTLDKQLPFVRGWCIGFQPCDIAFVCYSLTRTTAILCCYDIFMQRSAHSFLGGRNGTEPKTLFATAHYVSKGYTFAMHYISTECGFGLVPRFYDQGFLRWQICLSSQLCWLRLIYDTMRAHFICGFRMRTKRATKWCKYICRKRIEGNTQGRRRAGAWRRHCSLPFQKGEQRGRRCIFVTASQVISWFINIELKHICCSYSHTQRIHTGFR